MTPAATPKTTLAQALLAAQQEMPAIRPDTVNPHFKSDFVSLDKLIAVTRPILNRHGVVLIQQPGSDPEGRPILRTILIHADTSDKLICDTPLLLEKENSQGQGSAISYARRYALTAMLGISEKDDDGEAASAPAKPAKPAKPKQPVEETAAPSVFVKPPDGDPSLPEKQKNLQATIDLIVQSGWLTEEQITAAVQKEFGHGVFALTPDQIDGLQERLTKFKDDQVKAAADRFEETDPVVA